MRDMLMLIMYGDDVHNDWDREVEQKRGVDGDETLMD